MQTVQRIRTKGNATRLVAGEGAEGFEGVSARVAVIQALIPLGLEAVAEGLKQEVVALAGERHARAGRQPGLVRWGRQRGSVYLADQKVPVVVPRVRDRQRQVEGAAHHVPGLPGAARRGRGVVPPDLGRVGVWRLRGVRGGSAVGVRAVPLDGVAAVCAGQCAALAGGAGAVVGWRALGGAAD